MHAHACVCGGAPSRASACSLACGACGAWSIVQCPPPRLQAGGSAEALALPIIAKDLMIDPIQIAQAISQGADAVLLVASAVAGELPERTPNPLLLPTRDPNP
jgi:hypothetical protein